MTTAAEQEWLAASEPRALLRAFRNNKVWRNKVGSSRQWRLFACVCCRQVLHLLADPYRHAIEVAERFADRLATPVEVAAAFTAVYRAARATTESVRHAEIAATKCLTQTKPLRRHMLVDREMALQAASYAGLALLRLHNEAALRMRQRATADAQQADWLRDILGNPWRPVALTFSWLTPIVVRLARTAYEERRPEGTFDPEVLAALHDALLDAGCDHTEVLTHLRSTGSHVRGCWVVDLLLGKSPSPSRRPRKTVTT